MERIIVSYEWFTGDYSSWEEALKFCDGYNKPNILEKVKNSLLKVKKGEAVYERDSVLFDHIEYSMPLLVSLLYMTTVYKNNLNILDFGGSLGSSYFQNRKFLEKLDSLKWSIVEQNHFVDCGKEFFADEKLKFYHTIEECLKMEKPEVILFSGVLPYIANPFAFIGGIMEFNFKYIIIDRTPFFVEDIPDRITIEHVPPEIYDAKYPSAFFNYKKFLNFFRNKYNLKESFDSWERWDLNGTIAQNKCFIFEKIE